MMTLSMRRCGRGILLIGLLMILVACDGGIFGTGDGSSVPVTDDTIAGAPEADSSVDDSSAGTESPDAETVQPGDAVEDSDVESRPFENLQIGSDSDQPLLALVNFSSIPLNITTPDTDTLFATAIASGSISNDASIAPGTTRLSVVDATSSDPLLALSPLNLGAFSVSTVIARDQRLTNETGSLPDVEIIAIPSQRLPGDDGVASVRLLLASPLDMTDQAASMSLIPADATPGGSETNLGIVSAASFGTQSDYLPVAPGSYRLVDSLGRLTPIPVELVGGEVNTLILTGSPIELVVLRDSQVSDESASRPEKRARTNP